MRSYLTLALVTTLAGCANYVEPLVGSSAKMRFVSLPGNATEIHEIEDQRCPGNLIAKLGLNIKDGTNQGRSLRMPLQESVPRAAATELNVRATRPLAVQFKAAPGRGPQGTNWSYGACHKSFVITPKQDELYEAQLEQHADGCQLNLFRLVRDKDGGYARQLERNVQALKVRCN